MFKLKKNTESGRGIVYSVISGVLILLLSCFVFAVLSAFSKDPTAMLVPYSLAALTLSAFISGMLSGKKHRSGKSSAPILTVGIIILLMLIAGLIGGAGFSLALILNLLSYGGIFIATAFIFARKKKGHKRRTAR